MNVVESVLIFIWCVHLFGATLAAMVNIHNSPIKVLFYYNKSNYKLFKILYDQ